MSDHQSDKKEKKTKSGFDLKKCEAEPIEKLRSGSASEGKDGILAPLIKLSVEVNVDGQIKAHLNGAKGINRRNSKAGKQVKTAFGSVEIQNSSQKLCLFI